MGYNLKRTRKAILNKWDWENPNNNIPVFLWGGIGIGKTSVVEDIIIERKLLDLEAENTEESKKKIERLKNFKTSKEIQDILEENMLVLRMAERPIEQIQGIPAPLFETNSATFLMPDNMVKLKKVSWIVIFIDEIDKCCENKMAAMTHLIESKRIGDFSFPKDTFIICAGNRVEDSWLSREVVPELKNRGAHINVEPDLDDWTEWAIKNNIRKDIISFLRYMKSLNKNYLIRRQEGDNSFGSPRTWHYASLQADKIEAKADKTDEKWREELYDEVEQLVGIDCASEYKAYVELYMKVNIDNILNGTQAIPKIDSKIANAISKQYIYAMAICEQITKEKLAEPNKLDNFIKAINCFVGDVFFIMMITLKNKNKDIIDIIGDHKDGEKLINAFFENLDDSKL